MSPKNLICSYDKSVKLIDLGVRFNTEYYWVTKGKKKIICHGSELHLHLPSCKKLIPTYTVGELGILLPSNNLYPGRLFTLRFDKVDNNFRIRLESFTHRFSTHWFVNRNEADLRADILIWLIDNKCIDPKELKL